MGYSPKFPRAERALDEIEAAALAQEAIDAARWALAARTTSERDAEEAKAPDAPLPTAQIAETLAPAGPERVLHVEHLLVAAIWLGSIGVGLFRLLM
jgi:hypothetical protein